MLKQAWVVLSCVAFLGLASTAIAAVHYYDGQSYTVGGTAGADIYLGTTINDYLTLDDYLVNTFGTHLNLNAGGSIQYSLVLHNQATVTMTGGSVGYNIHAEEDTTVTMSGGLVGLSFVAQHNAVIYLEGSNFSVTASGVTTALGNVDNVSSYATLIEDGNSDYYFGTITGTLADGTTLDNTFYIYNTGPYYGGT
ncbi:unnamed protein product, partial [marine sediment metagenome]